MSVVRLEPSSPTDYQLLENFNLVIGYGIAKPAQLPLSYVCLSISCISIYSTATSTFPMANGSGNIFSLGMVSSR
jgi:hypothetical protein